MAKYSTLPEKRSSAVKEHMQEEYAGEESPKSKSSGSCAFHPKDKFVQHGDTIVGSDLQDGPVIDWIEDSEE